MFMELLRNLLSSLKQSIGIYSCTSINSYIYFIGTKIAQFINLFVLVVRKFNKLNSLIRWDLTAAETLPLYMKITLKALYETTNDISNKIHAKHGWNPFKSLQKSVCTYKKQSNALLFYKGQKNTNINLRKEKRK